MAEHAHHAELHLGELENVLDTLDATERTPGPDIHFMDAKRFSVAEARLLKDMASLTPVEKGYRVFIITAHSLTREAQNALLKLFEEPPRTARFHLIVPREEVLIPTLRSRLLYVGREMKSEVSAAAQTFLESPYRVRLQLIATHMKEKDDVWAEDVLRGSEIYCRERGNYDALKDIAFVRKYFSGPGASKKMLLEHLALSLSAPE